MSLTLKSRASGLALAHLKEPNDTSIEKSGWLLKWTNYVKGYRQRWFIIDSKGILSYYRTQSEVGRNCRGSINLREARIICDKTTSQITVTNGSQSFHLKTQNDIDEGQWLKALQNAHHVASTSSRIDDDYDICALSEAANTQERVGSVETELKEKMSQMKQIATTIGGSAFELSKLVNNSSPQSHQSNSQQRKKILQEAENLSNLATSLVEESNLFIGHAIGKLNELARQVRKEHERRICLQEQLETLAWQHRRLELDTIRSLTVVENGKHKLSPHMSLLDQSSEDVFHDAHDFEEDVSSRSSAVPDNISAKSESAFSNKHSNTSGEDTDDTTTVDIDTCVFRSSSPSNSLHSRHSYPPSTAKQHSCTTMTANGNIPLNNGSNSNDDNNNVNGVKKDGSEVRALRRRRTSIPSRPDFTLNLWSFVRDCIGKELTRISIPVNFNEPLSFLQRITEDLEYSFLLDQAAEKDDPFEQLAYIAAYTISAYSTTINRLTKPFNPLLGETFEFDRFDDYGWRCLAEQVSHHPPIAARHVDARKWTLYHETQLTSTFRGKYLSVVPIGNNHIHFKNSNTHFTFQKVTTTVHNIIVGKLWIDNHGEMVIQNHSTGDKAIVKFNAYNYFSTEKPRKVHGIIKNKQGEVKWVLQGFWDKYLNIMRVSSHHSEGGKNIIDTEAPIMIWTANPPFPGSEKMYNFTKFTIELNEEDELVAPTDSRRRPDQRLMEQGHWDEANRMKNQLEEKQRRSRRQFGLQVESAIRENRTIPEYHPCWFEKTKDPYTRDIIHKLIYDEYWRCKEKCDWDRCPNIY